MAGAGKSVLAAQVVRDPELLKDHFECSIHWLTIGRTDKDSLLTKMQVSHIKNFSILFKFSNCILLRHYANV